MRWAVFSPVWSIVLCHKILMSLWGFLQYDL